MRYFDVGQFLSVKENATDPRLHKSITERNLIAVRRVFSRSCISAISSCAVQFKYSVPLLNQTKVNSRMEKMNVEFNMAILLI